MLCKPGSSMSRSNTYSSQATSARHITVDDCVSVSLHWTHSCCSVHVKSGFQPPTSVPSSPNACLSVWTLDIATCLQSIASAYAGGWHDSARLLSCSNISAKDGSWLCVGIAHHSANLISIERDNRSQVYSNQKNIPRNFACFDEEAALESING